MRRVLIAALLLGLLPATSMAGNVGECGWGSKVFHGQKGIAPQVLAVTTNGTSGNQTFAITSGTSGCTQSGAVRSSWKTAAFVDENMTKFARDVSRGHGESLDSFAQLIGVPGEKVPVLASLLQENFGKIFPSENVASAEVLAGLRGVIAADKELTSYAAQI